MEQRRANDGELYSFQEFSEHYKQRAQWMWDQCQPVARDGNGMPLSSGVSPPAGHVCSAVPNVVENTAVTPPNTNTETSSSGVNPLAKQKPHQN